MELVEKLLLYRHKDSLPCQGPMLLGPLWFRAFGFSGFFGFFGLSGLGFRVLVLRVLGFRA